MKLKCDDHNARVIVTPLGNVIHRRDNRVCSDNLLAIGKRIVTPVTVARWGRFDHSLCCKASS